MPTGLPFTKVLLAHRQDYFRFMKTYLMKKAAENRIHIIGMRPVFSKHYLTYRKKFEFLADGHWNATGPSCYGQGIYQKPRIIRLTDIMIPDN